MSTEGHGYTAAPGSKLETEDEKGAGIRAWLSTVPTPASAIQVTSRARQPKEKSTKASNSDSPSPGNTYQQSLLSRSILAGRIVPRSDVENLQTRTEALRRISVPSTSLAGNSSMSTSGEIPRGTIGLVARLSGSRSFLAGPPGQEDLSGMSRLASDEEHDLRSASIEGASFGHGATAEYSGASDSSEMSEGSGETVDDSESRDNVGVTRDELCDELAEIQADLKWVEMDVADLMQTCQEELVCALPY